MTIRKWASTSKTRFIPTEKARSGNVSLSFMTDRDLAYCKLADLIDERFTGKKAPTIEDIFSGITGPMGLSFAQTEQLVENACRSSYLNRVYPTRGRKPSK